MTYVIDNISFAYAKKPVVQGISLRIEPGEFVAVIGPNGAGKSTLLKLMAGLLSGFQGSVNFMGRSIVDYKPVELARKVAFVPQETHVAFPFTVYEMILMGRMPYRQSFLFDTETDDQFVRQAMALTETEHLSGKMFTEISGGERQRVVLASALAQTPEVLLLDEPTVYLDMKHQLQFYEILRHLNADKQMTVVAVTHDVNLASRHAGRMIAICEGTIVTEGTSDQVLTAEKLQQIFGITAHIIERPDGGRYVIPTA